MEINPITGNINKLRSGFSKINTALFQPSKTIEEIGEKRQVELLAKLTFFFAALNTLGLLFAWKFQNTVGILVLLTLSLVLWIAYGLSRTRYYAVGGAVAITIWVVITFAYALSGSTTNGPLFVLAIFLPLVFALGTALLTYRYQVALIVISLVLCLLMPVFEPGITSNRSFNSSIGVLICLGGLTLLNQSYRNKIEQERFSELAAKNEAIRFQAELLNRVGQAVIASRLDNTVLYWNQAAEKMYGWLTKEVLGKNILEIAPNKATPETLEKITTALRAGKDWQGDMAVQHRSGHLIPVLYTIAALKDGSGKNTGWISVAADITERKEAEDALQRSEDMYRRAIMTAGAVPYYKDHRYDKYTFMGEGILQMTGYTASEMKPEIWKVIQQEGFPRGGLAHLTYEEADELTENDNSIVWECDYRIRTRDGQTRWVADTSVKGLNEYGERVGVIGILQDITDRKNALLERERLINDLEARNAELERFTYTVSHDLKSPLVTIQGYLGYIEEDAVKGNVERVRKDAQRIKDATIRMQNLLKDLLQLSRVGRMLNPLEDVPLSTIVQEALTNVAGQIEKQKVQIEVNDHLPTIHVDRARLVEVFQNLIDNACKYMGAQPEPHITVGQRTEKSGTIFYVRDNGIGIEPQYHEKIFGLFDQLDPDREGTGIGLALVKRIIETHNGRIWVESEGAGKGSTFCFTLGSVPSSSKTAG